MKKIILFLFMVLFLPFGVHASDVNYDIDLFKIDAHIREDGSVVVYEYIKQTGTFNGYVRDLVYSSNSSYDAASIDDVTVYDLNVLDNSKGQEFKEVDYANNGDNLVYQKTNTYNGISLKMFNSSYNESKGYVIKYTLNDVVLVHDDVAEFYWNFIGEDFGDVLKNVSINVYLPTKDDSLKVWVHGPLYGECYPRHEDTSYLEAKIDFVNPNTPVDVRMTFDFKNVPNSYHKTNKVALNEILDEEEKLANEANRERLMKKYIPRVVSVLYFVIIIAILIYCYVKYDKEYKTNFIHKYYRELPNTYGPEVVEYLYKMNVSELAYSASVLEIIRKKGFKIEEVPNNKKDYTFIKNERPKEVLTKEESIILDYLINDIGNGKEVRLSAIKDFGNVESSARAFLAHFKSWQNSVITNANTYNFFEENKAGKFILIIVLLTIGAGFVIANYSPVLLFVIILVGIASFIYVATIKKRTKNGALEYSKWEAFKRFLVDFGKFDDKELPEIVLWEQYLVYATVLGVAKDLQKTMKIKISQMETTDSVDVVDLYTMNMLMNANLCSSVSQTVNKAISVSNATIASSHASSGSGMGGGFSSGGGGGGGGGGGHGF